MWDLSCLDWETRIRDGRSLIPELPLFREEAEMALAFFDELRLPDVPGLPKMADGCGPWFREIVEVLFGSLDPETGERFIEEVFALVAKKNSKTTYSAGLMLTALLMNHRPQAEFMFVGPTQAISELAFSQASGMVRADPVLLARFRIKDHVKEIEDLQNRSKLKIKTFSLDILTGPRPVGVLLDELHLLGRHASTAKVLRQLRGGRQANPEGFMIIATTQSDEPPTGAFKTELFAARDVRDGKKQGGVLLPVLYEFPEDIATDKAAWSDAKNWPMVMPNLGRSLRIDSLLRDFRDEAAKGVVEETLWVSQHLNIQVGLGTKNDRWRGADFWLQQVDTSLVDLEHMLSLCDVATVGIDGGGLDDLLGGAVLGRHRHTRQWLLWNKAWCAHTVLDLRKEIAPALLDFVQEGTLKLVDPGSGEDVSDVVDLVEIVRTAGLLPDAKAIGVDPAGITEIVDELQARGFEASPDGNGAVVGLSQGWQLTNIIKTTERRLAGNNLLHGGTRLMAWCVGNAKVEPRGNAITITKQQSGTAKIDPLMATFNAATLMAMNPAVLSPYEDRGIRVG